jgi:stringent starvation protein B
MNDSTIPSMSSNRPYLLRALYEWINDNQMTPYILVDANGSGVQVPASSIKDGRVVLNLAPRAVVQLEIGNTDIRFLARFGGVSQSIRVPVSAVLAIYAQETGQGMALPEPSEMDADAETVGSDPDPAPPSAPGEGAKRGAHLKVVK